MGITYLEDRDNCEDNIKMDLGEMDCKDGW